MKRGIFQALRGSGIQLPEDEKEARQNPQAGRQILWRQAFYWTSQTNWICGSKRGAGARFILNEQLLRATPVTTVPLGRLTLTIQKFVGEALAWFDANGLDRASQWLNRKGIYLPADTDRWLQEMLEAAGFLINLSDSC